jgi:hypothetical protein
MRKLQTTVSEEIEKKIVVYSAYLGIAKNDFIRQALLFRLRDLEQNVIPKGITENIIKKEINEG